jgi:hypothetical protein
MNKAPTNWQGARRLQAWHLKEKGWFQPQMPEVLSVSYPLPRVVRICSPIGHTFTLREWRTRDHLSAIRAISPEGKLYFHGRAAP